MARKARRGAGEGAVFQRVRRTKDGKECKLWVAEVTIGRGTQGRRRKRTLYGRTRAEVQEKLRKLMREVDDGLVADPGRLTVTDLVDRYLIHKRQSLQPTTWGDYRARLRAHVLSRIGGIRLARLAPVHIVDWLAALDRDKVGPRAQQLTFDVLRRCLSFGVKVGLLSRNPAVGLDRPQVEQPEIQSLTAVQASQLLRVARESEPPWVTAAVALGLCGLRRGEVFGLRWEDADLSEGKVQIRRALKETTWGERMLGQVKTKSARRKVPLPDWARVALLEHRTALGALPHPTRLVFTTTTNSPIHFSNFVRRAFSPLIKRAGLPPGTTFHALRHTAATLLIAAGADIKSVQAILGHARASHTLDLYADFVPSNVDRAMAGLEAVVDQAGDVTSRA